MSTSEDAVATPEVDQCSNPICDQGRKCPRRLNRRAGPSIFWRLMGWLMRERRGGFDRRARADETLAPVGCPWVQTQCTRCGGNHPLSQCRWPVVNQKTTKGSTS